MKPTSPALAVFATVALWAFILVAPRVGAADLAMTPLVGDVLWPPRVARVSDDQRHLVYELRLANPTPAAIDLTRIDVIEPRSGRPAAIAHRVSVVLRPDRAFTVTTAETSVIDGKPVVLGPPLVGTGYLAGDGCCDTIRHVRALLPLTAASPSPSGSPSTGSRSMGRTGSARETSRRSRASRSSARR